MSFIRAKEIPPHSGNWYDYEVKSVNLGNGKIRQIHIRYIGKSTRHASISPPAQCKSKVVPFKDWNDVVKPENLPDIDYKVSLHPRKSRVKSKPVTDAVLTPILGENK